MDDYIIFLKTEKKLGVNSITSYEFDLDSFFKFFTLDVVNCTKNDILGYIGSLKGSSVSTINRHISSLKGYFNYLLENNYIRVNPMEDISTLKKSKLLPKYLSISEVDNLLNIKLVTPFDYRNKAMLELMYGTGLRVSELVNIKISDIDINERTIKVLGKGSKERMVIFNNHTKKAIEIYLNDGYHEFNKLSSGYLILNKDGNKLSERYIRNIINKLVTKAGLDIKISPHTFRHTFATDMLEDGSDLMTVKELLGHESLNTTSIYTHVTNEQIRKVYEMAHPRAKK